MALFDQKAPGIMAGLMRDVAITDFQAGGILGNIGWECAAFTKLHQVGGSAIGWVQWDGVRKANFAAWCARNKLDWQSDEANYRYLVLELQGSEAKALAALKRTRDVDEASDVFEETFERAGKPALTQRRAFARRAMAAYAASDKVPISFGQPQTNDQPPSTGLPTGGPPRLPPRQPDDPGVSPQPASSGFFDALASLLRAVLALFRKGT